MCQLPPQGKKATKIYSDRGYVEDLSASVGFRRWPAHVTLIPSIAGLITGNSYFFPARLYLGPCQCPCLGTARGMMDARLGLKHVRLSDVTKQVNHLKQQPDFLLLRLGWRYWERES